MKREKIKKQPIKSSSFYMYSGFGYFLVFYISIMIHYITYPKFGENNDYSILFSNIYLILMPTLYSISITYISIIIFLNSKNLYINKFKIAKVRDALAQFSVFLIIILNSVSFLNKELKLELDSQITAGNQIKDFIILSLQPINIVYSIPIVFSIPTLILLALEYTPFASRKYKMVNVPEEKLISKSEQVVILESITFDISKIIKESKQLLNK